VVGIRRLEEAIHGVMVRRATPDWLPFVPGRVLLGAPAAAPARGRRDLQPDRYWKVLTTLPGFRHVSRPCLFRSTFCCRPPGSFP
jgi:hypothetical protein